MSDAKVNEWLLDYVAVMEETLAKHPNPVGLHRAMANRALEKRLAEVRAYLKTLEGT
jgi:hypothetical protein